MVDWSQCSAVERVPGKVSGEWLFKGTRVPVRALFENLESGARIDDFLEWFPGVTRQQVALVLRHADRSPAVLRKLAKGETDGRVARRILAIANALDGMSRKAAAEAAGMDRQTLRDWVLRYNEHGIGGLTDRWGDGRPPTFDAQEQAELVRIVLAGPDPETSGLSAYTLEDLAGICEQRFGK